MSVPSVTATPDPFGARASLATSLGTTVTYYRLATLVEQGIAELDRLPFTIRILLENLLRNAGTEFVSESDVSTLAGWTPESKGQDFKLALRQIKSGRRGLIGFLHQGLSGLRREGGATGVGRADGLHQFIGRDILEQIANRSGLQSISDKVCCFK